MITGGATEQILHFIGYLHLDELLKKTTITYSGTYGPAADENFAVGTPSDPKPAVGSTPDAAPPIQIDSPLFHSGRLRAHPDNRPEGEGPPAPKFSIETNFGGTAAAFPGSSSPGGGIAAVTLTQEGGEITISYTMGGSQYFVVDLSQYNGLVDNDQMLQDAVGSAIDNLDLAFKGETLAAAGEGVGGAHQTDIPALLEELIDAAQEHIASAGMKDHPQIDGYEKDSVKTGYRSEDEEKEPSEHSHGSHKKEAGETTAGHDAAPTNDDLEAASSSAPSEVGSVHVEPGSVDPGSDPDVIVTGGPGAPGAPTDGIAQIATLGGNEAINAALVVDFSEGWGSMIVKGDYYETNLIIQTNILHDNDLLNFSGSAFVQTVITSDNTTDNNGEFVDDDSALFGNPAFGNLPVGITWKVDYVNGDFFDVVRYIQTNEMVDNDINMQVSSTSHFVLEMGDNQQFNFSEIFNYGKSYDLIIIEGNYYEFNSIIQTNILLDDDILALAGSQGLEAGADASGLPVQSADSGSNELLNEASILNVGGGDRFSPLTDGAAELADQIADGVGSIPLEQLFPELALLPGNGTDVFDVLYVSGDYIEYKSIEQTNVIVDVDTSEQGLDGADPDEIEQDVASGGNSAINEAKIVDVDSTSDYQYLGGEYYKDEMLVQANITTDDDEVTENGNEIAAAAQGAQGYETAIAVHAALAANDKTLGQPSQDAPGQSLGNSAGDDGVGGVLG